MKKLYLVLLLPFMILITGCNELLELIEESEDKTIRIEIGDSSSNNQPSPDQERPSNEEDETAEDKHNENNQTSNEHTSNNSTVEQEHNEKQQNTEASSSTKKQTALNVRDLLLKSYEAMKDVHSLKLTGTIESNLSNFYQDTLLIIDIDATHNYLGKISTHEFIEVDDGRTEPMNMELYTIPTHQWARNVNHEPDTWYENPINVDSYRTYQVLMAHHLEEFSKQAELFEVIEQDSSFIVHFTGNDTEFIEHIYLQMDDLIQAYIPPNLDEITFTNGEFSLIINKETLYVDSYQLKHEEEITGLSEEEDYHLTETAEYQFSNYNEYNMLDIPTEIVENSVK